MDQWRPVLDWPEAKIWDIIRRNRVRPHPAYYLGWGRVSCLACIFGDADQWASVRALDEARFSLIRLYEERWGKTIKRGHTVEEQANRGTPFAQISSQEGQRRLAMGRDYPARLIFVPPGEEWVMPAGAFRRCGGPT